MSLGCLQPMPQNHQKAAKTAVIFKAQTASNSTTTFKKKTCIRETLNILLSPICSKFFSGPLPKRAAFAPVTVHYCSDYTNIFHTNSSDKFADKTVPRAVLLTTAALAVVNCVQRVSKRGTLGQRLQQVDQIAAVLVISARVDVIVVTWR